jgi:protein transport protein SEC61 subunit gamma-like protein
MSLKEKIKSAGIKFKSFLIECRRVFHATKKPSKQEYLTIVKVAGLGIIAIGAIGFLIQTAVGLFK